MPDFSQLPRDYAGTPFPDGKQASGAPAIFTLGRHNKWGYLSILGPDQKEFTLGLVSNFTITETNDSSFIPQAGADWLELQIGSRMWRGSASRLHVRGADMKQMMLHMYPAASDADFRFFPFVFKYNFVYQPPIGLSKPIEQSAWVYHKILIVSYTNDLITGANRLLEERFDFIGAGETFSTGGATSYQSNPIVWAGETYNTNPPPPATSTISTGATNLFNGIGNIQGGTQTSKGDWFNLNNP